MALSLDATCHIIAAGAGLKPDAIRELPKQVFQAGVGTVAPQLVPYVVFLLNPSYKDAEEDSGNALEAAGQ